MTGIYSNFTEETGTGTGDTLALAGATSGNIQFQDSFADGDLVAYVVEDSGGSIKVAGVGLYVSATDDITRQDTWNFNGSVVDENPTTNITLSGGTHTIRGDSVDDDFNTGGAVSGRIYISSVLNEIAATITHSATNRIVYVPFLVRFADAYDAFAFEVTTSGTDLRLGLYTAKDGLPNALIAVHDTSFSVGTTGLKSASFDGGSLNLRKGNYFIAYHNNGSVSLRAANNDSILASQFGDVVIGASIVGNASKARTYGAMPDPADISGLSFNAAAAAFGIEAA